MTSASRSPPGAAMTRAGRIAARSNSERGWNRKLRRAPSAPLAQRRVLGHAPKPEQVLDPEQGEREYLKGCEQPLVGVEHTRYACQNTDGDIGKDETEERPVHRLRECLGRTRIEKFVSARAGGRASWPRLCGP